MKNLIYIVIAILIIASGFVFFRTDLEENDLGSDLNKVTMSEIRLTSRVFAHGGIIPSKYTCDGENINPPLKIESVPSEAKSLVLIMDDPDAVKPAGKVWDHWIVFNIPPTLTEVLEGEETQGVHGKGTGENTDYRGPCPPDGEHRYFFKAYALDTVLSLEAGAIKREVEQAIKGHIIAQGMLMGKYSRP
ncbi:MAG: Raf kinase inhibitor-like protein, YbhB/YbcL family [Parcubacteria group bacterium Gr01-1014_107]|nr:MAG: Raf kinase inhibitor-like protein, YbhB/YbcL family [Parcubacteria group bacterium Gr01-1014_107]